MNALLKYLKSADVKHVGAIFVSALVAQPLIQALLFNQPADLTRATVVATLLGAVSAAARKLIPGV